MTINVTPIQPNVELVEVPHLVAVLDEHLLTDPETGREIEYLTPAKLNQIAANCNRRVKDTGDEVPLVIGHTRDGAAEKDQPEVVGFARDFQVLPFFKTGKKAIFSRWRVYKNKVHLLKQFPRRSVEIWLDKRELDPIALLGATTPDRDLGLVRLSRGRGTISYTMGDKKTMNDDTGQAPKSMTVEQLMESPVWKFAEELYNEAMSMGDQGDEQPEEGAEPATEPEEEPLPEDDEAPLPEEEEEVAPPVKKQASFPGGGNTYVPSTGNERQRMSRQDESARIKLARIEKAQKEQAEENRTLRVQLARANRERDLIQLEAEGFDFDRDEELNSVCPEDGEPLPEKQYQSHLSRIRKRYSRVPIGGQRFHLADEPGVSVGDRQAQVDKAVALCSANPGLSFEHALAQVQGQ